MSNTNGEQTPTLDECMNSFDYPALTCSIVWEKLPLAYREASKREHERLHSQSPPGTILSVSALQGEAIKYNVNTGFRGKVGLAHKYQLYPPRSHTFIDTL